LPARTWLAVATNAGVSGILIGWTAENVPLESLTVGGWMRSLAWLAVAALAPLATAAATASKIAVPSFAWSLGQSPGRQREPLALALGLLLIALTMLAVQAALGLVFDPRYRDFPDPALTAATVPFLLATRWPRRTDLRASAETAAAAVLALSALYILFNETVANWQAVWFCAAAAALALTLVPARAAPS
jgi:glucan 1,3-beta-glucosidase